MGSRPKFDGTKEFIEGVPLFSISIGMVSNGKPVIGVITILQKMNYFLLLKVVDLC
ncbi:MAG: hypothetical protein Ct9H90mP20_3210 [Candidatus Neomarinimicrobiota bacterium]|nr:MAG: hypothetical protein Ct9H90mP20_3210 [Candidatus Neomarinimicrobiota bacterium]